MLVFDTYYHIYNHGNADDNLFREQKNYDFFLKKYHQHISPIAETIAWCLMPNHFHLLIKTRMEEEILSFYQASNSSKVWNFGRVEEAGNEKKILLSISSVRNSLISSAAIRNPSISCIKSEAHYSLKILKGKK